MKKHACLILAAVLLITLSGCGESVRSTLSWLLPSDVEQQPSSGGSPDTPDLTDVIDSPSEPSDKEQGGASPAPPVSAPSDEPEPEPDTEPVPQAPHEHAFGEWIVAEAPTCTSEGREERRCACGETESHTLAPLAHTYGQWAVETPPTCTGDGIEARTCALCGERETRPLAAAGHSFGGWETVRAATCTRGGSLRRVCSVCGAEETEPTDAAGHRWGDWIVTQEATETTEGAMYRLCAVCGERETEVIPVRVLSESEKYALALQVAREIAASIGAGSDLYRVSTAAQIVSSYCARCEYTTEGSDYRLAYGVFIKGEYSCAGATRALGMVLECMGYAWEHANENQWSHQWCIVSMDGQQGWADGQIGLAGYGIHPYV